MTPERWQEVKKVLAAALERAPEERSVYLDQACTDPALRREVESLITAHEHGDTSFMERPVVGSDEALKSGTKLGPYEILARIGAGGMGEVYRAHDTKLKRDVAIKVLPPAFVNDPERLARFQREARMLASLNHPNIAAIYGLEESGSTRGLVMELVQGPTLADRIRQSPIPVQEALPIAKQMAEALEYAHEHGIIHRDLKPANVKQSSEGAVKILDFGLAKAMETYLSAADLANSPTISRMATEVGVLLGTAAYMSPEQAKAKPVDRRADIWAFGCVLYEMLAGKMAFRGETVTDTLAAVLTREPDWSHLPTATPMRVRVLLQRCLQKDPRQRLRDIGDARISLDETVSGAPESTLTAGAALPTWRHAIPWAAGLLAVAVAGFAGWNLKPSPAPPAKPVTRFAITLPQGQRLAGLNQTALALSPDGSQLAYVASTQDGTQEIYLRAMDSTEIKPVPGTEGAVIPFFSPDGQWLGFFADGKMKKVSVNGGVAVNLADALFPGGASWSKEGKILFTPILGASSIYEVSDAGGAVRPLTRLDKEESAHRWPEYLPDGKAVLFEAPSGRAGVGAQVVIESLAAGERRNLMAGMEPHYAPSGHLIYVLGGSLMAVPFDPRRLTVTGPAVSVLGAVFVSSTYAAAGQYTFSNTGSLAYVPGGVQPVLESKLVWVTRSGAEQPLAAAVRGYAYPKISPDGGRVALTVGTQQDSQLWLYDLVRGTLSRLTFEGNTNFGPVWTPDGRRIAFRSNKEGQLNAWWQLADGSGGLERLASSENLQAPLSWSPDGQLLAYVEMAPTTQQDIWVLRMGSSSPGQGRKAQLFLGTPFNEDAPQFSPDGHWLAYTSDESGRNEVYVQPYPGPAGKWQISTDGGTEPVWNHNGQELFYRSGDKMMAVDVATQPSFVAGKPRMLFQRQYVANLPPGAFPFYDVSPDGQRFLMLKPVEQSQAGPTQINVVLNWFEELKRRVPTGK